MSLLNMKGVVRPKEYHRVNDILESAAEEKAFSTILKYLRKLKEMPMYLETLQTTNLARQVRAINKLAQQEVKKLEKPKEHSSSAEAAGASAQSSEVQVVRENSNAHESALQSWKQILELAAKLTDDWKTLARRELKRQRERAISEAKTDAALENAIDRAERLKTLDYFVHSGQSSSASQDTEQKTVPKEARVKLGAGFDGHYITTPIPVDYAEEQSSSASHGRKRQKQESSSS
eukprot:gb/GECG01007526.1/.p1 GENE.gb/GECG01007526.1/~~gb/GECG01007526.1/.p1  ORF type:complete len:234 (+),score=50.31 gb/GECG01007526.1/:1-702(+)